MARIQRTVQYNVLFSLWNLLIVHLAPSQTIIMSSISTVKPKIGSVVQDDKIKQEVLRHSVIISKCRHHASCLLLYYTAVHCYDAGLELPPPLKEGARHTQFMAHVFHPHPEINHDRAWELSRGVRSRVLSAALDHFQDQIQWPVIGQVEGLWRHVHYAALEYATNLHTHFSLNYKTFIKYTIHTFCDKINLVYIKHGAFVKDFLKNILIGGDHTMTVFQVAQREMRFELFLSVLRFLWWTIDKSRFLPVTIIYQVDSKLLEEFIDYHHGYIGKKKIDFSKTDEPQMISAMVLYFVYLLN